ncbi:hypothetical protein H310_11474 [Aphanomyces invadans]|uniref:Reverse transcriptase RNase H-like domain-containing protein n=1 Tax=Aphanomyces invadans TaxID=157072 RepID=A0A024TKY3_9STRA|nr:hypothetical protein H310_11474 [Aphanomyces invadans]ETV94800.1 hypothetical protein H310_11474 [Aphanomyces invadans]|eukprot:XP_008876391.1 hypothetical protein H310_11474 [Aphanomyces invadans]
MERLGFKIYDVTDVGNTSSTMRCLQMAYQEDPKDDVYAEGVTCYMLGWRSSLIKMAKSSAFWMLQRILEKQVEDFRLEFVCEICASTSSQPLKVGPYEGALPVKCALRRILDVAAKVADESKKAALTCIQLDAVGWAGERDECFAAVKKTLQQVVPLSHRSADKIFCFMLMRVRRIAERHALISRRFRSSCRNRVLGWPTVEEAVFAIFESGKRLEYLLLRQQGFRLFTDH